ncbi:DUF3048 domain-containing protein [Clostridium gasigenes]|uniref:DUF3048 domain-containing protein n=1 Tax=Clostridium gasigenes TaxID=94869 RepID=UPI001C0DEE1E|nr:DUF3048 domain-containing protein [Clostridium gasigenes]MBU3105742.1 DUF3048 domain-containing protein [Clostridium gasigenes]
MKSKFSLLSLIILISLIGCSPKEDSSLKTSTNMDGMVPSFYTGENIKESTNSNTPFMVMIENSTSSRPQSGLGSADVIYETSAEGGIPRFMALFHKDSADIIGPVRSIRPYFLELALENNLSFAHCGGSVDALTSISKDSSIMSINELSNGSYFWRDPKRKSPHNLYTSSKNILDSIIDKKFLSIPKPFAEFNKAYYSNEVLTSISNIRLNLNKSYDTSYLYEDNVYKKSMDGKIALDASTNKQLSFANVVIQKTTISLQDDNLHLDIDLIGEGDGYVFSNGRYVNVLWKKSNENDKTILYDINGDIVPLSPGKTIWHIVNNNTDISFD